MTSNTNSLPKNWLARMNELCSLKTLSLRFMTWFKIDYNDNRARVKKKHTQCCRLSVARSLQRVQRNNAYLCRKKTSLKFHTQKSWLKNKLFNLEYEMRNPLSRIAGKVCKLDNKKVNFCFNYFYRICTRFCLVS